MRDVRRNFPRRPNILLPPRLFSTETYSHIQILFVREKVRRAEPFVHGSVVNVNFLEKGNAISFSHFQCKRRGIAVARMWNRWKIYFTNILYEKTLTAKGGGASSIISSLPLAVFLSSSTHRIFGIRPTGSLQPGGRLRRISEGMNATHWLKNSILNTYNRS